MNLENKRTVTFVTGASGTGKSTFALKYLLNRDFTCRFLFDPDGEYAARLKLTAARTGAELDRAFLSGWCVFDPTQMFPGDNKLAFALFCDFAWKLTGRQPLGRYVLFVDEVQTYCHPGHIPRELACIAEAGRKRGLELLLLAQRANRMHGDITAQWTEWATFWSDDRNVLATLEEHGFSKEEVAALPDLHFVSRSMRGGILRGVVKP